MIIFTKALTKELTQEAKCSPRKRKTLNIHKESGDFMQRMINAIEPGTYVQPHKHAEPEKREVFIALSGKAVVVTYDNSGLCLEHVIIEQDGNSGVEIPPGVWHSIIPLQSGTVVFEVKDGPYDPDTDKQFAPWAPSESDENASEFNARVLQQIDIIQ